MSASVECSCPDEHGEIQDPELPVCVCVSEHIGSRGPRDRMLVRWPVGNRGAQGLGAHAGRDIHSERVKHTFADRAFCQFL